VAILIAVVVALAALAIAAPSLLDPAVRRLVRRPAVRLARRGALAAHAAVFLAPASAPHVQPRRR
jgi:hypothetical protein